MPRYTKLSPAKSAIIQDAILRYPETKKKSAEYERRVLNLHHGHGSEWRSSTERKAGLLCSPYKLRLDSEIRAIETAVQEIRPEYLEVVKLRFWKYKQEKNNWVNVEYHSGFSESMAKRIVRDFIMRTGRNLGELPPEEPAA